MDFHASQQEPAFVPVPAPENREPRRSRRNLVNAKIISVRGSGPPDDTDAIITFDRPVRVTAEDNQEPADMANVGREVPLEIAGLVREGGGTQTEIGDRELVVSFVAPLGIPFGVPITVIGRKWYYPAGDEAVKTTDGAGVDSGTGYVLPPL